MVLITINNAELTIRRIRVQIIIVKMLMQMNILMHILLASTLMVSSDKLNFLIVGGQQYYQDQQRGVYDRKGKRNGSSEDDSESFSDFTMRSDMARAAETDMYRDERYYGRSTDSLSQMGDRRGYGRPPSSQISYGGNRS